MERTPPGPLHLPLIGDSDGRYDEDLDEDGMCSNDQSMIVKKSDPSDNQGDDGGVCSGSLASVLGAGPVGLWLDSLVSSHGQVVR